MNHALIGNDAGESTQGIYLTHELAFGDAPHGGIAGHLADLGHIHGDEQNPAAQVGRCRSRFIAGMASTYDDDVILGMFHVKHDLGFSRG